MNLTKLSILLATTALVASAPAAADKPSGKGPSGKAPTTTKKPAKKKVSRGYAPLGDCIADGDLDRVYTPGTLKLALRLVPTDVAQYTTCVDLLRFARTAGPVVPVTRKFARVKVRCTGSAYEVSVSVGDKLLGTATTKACKRGSRVLRIPVGSAGTTKAKKGALATIVAKPGDETLQFVARLAGRRRF